MMQLLPWQSSSKKFPQIRPVLYWARTKMTCLLTMSKRRPLYDYRHQPVCCAISILRLSNQGRLEFVCGFSNRNSHITNINTKSWQDIAQHCNPGLVDVLQPSTDPLTTLLFIYSESSTSKIAFSPSFIFSIINWLAAGRGFRNAPPRYCSPSFGATCISIAVLIPRKPYTIHRLDR